MICGSKYFCDKFIFQLRICSTLDKHKTTNRYIEMGKSNFTLLTSDPSPKTAQLSTERGHLSLRYLFLSCLTGNTKQFSLSACGQLRTWKRDVGLLNLAQSCQNPETSLPGRRGKIGVCHQCFRLSVHCTREYECVAYCGYHGSAGLKECIQLQDFYRRREMSRACTAIKKNLRYFWNW